MSEFVVQAAGPGGAELQDEITRLDKLFPTTKVNIPGDEESWVRGNGEGIWAVPATAEDSEILSTESHGKRFHVRIMNQAVYFPIEWGSLLLVEHRGLAKRPVAVPLGK